MVMRSLSQVPTGARLFCGRCAVAPFETATAVLSVWSGAISFFGVTITASVVNTLLPPQLVVLFNLLYVLSGAFMLAGLGWNYRNLEATGIIFLATSLIIRFIVLFVAAGFQPVILTALVTNLAFGLACGTRLVFLLKRRTLAIVELPRDAPSD